MTVEPALIDTIPALAVLSESEKIAFAGIVVRDHFDIGTVLFEEAQPAEEVFLLLEGKIELSVNMGRHGDKTVLTLGPGEFVGWAGMMPFDQFATGRVSEQASLLRMPGWALDELCEQDHEVGFAVMKILANELGRRMRDLVMGVRDAFDG